MPRTVGFGKNPSIKTIYTEKGLKRGLNPSS